MERKRNSRPLHACDKFFKAISVGSPFRPIRRISKHHHPQPTDPSAASASIPRVKTEEEEFTKYIKRAWKKIRTPSSVGGGKNGKINASASASGSGSGSGTATGEDHFSNYINRAKKKMLRTMSSFVGSMK